MFSVLSRLGGCALLAALAGCLIDRGALAPDEADAPDAHVADRDARGPDEDAGPRDEDAHEETTCGDGNVASVEGCDDGNETEGDGCGPSCEVERGFVCTGEPSRCAKTCGNGRLDPSEACDDGNEAADDGCAACVVEPGFSCRGEPSACTTTCGDGTRGGREECDDDNTDDGDGCDASCLFETTRRVARGPALALEVPDDAYDGSLDSMTCVELDVRPFPLDTLTRLEVELALRHPWVADLVIKLVGPGGRPVVTLMSRPSIDEPADDGTRMNGNEANLDSAAPIRFVDGAVVSAEDMGDGLGNRTVCASDGVCVFAPDPGAATPGALSSFVGGPASGGWRLCVADAAGEDIGVIDAVTLVMGLGR